jgi:hypothetical protein
MEKIRLITEPEAAAVYTFTTVLYYLAPSNCVVLSFRRSYQSILSRQERYSSQLTLVEEPSYVIECH